MIDTIILDKDGTMFDTEHMYYNYFVDAFKEFGFTYDMSIHKKVTGTNSEHVQKVFCDVLGLEYGDPRVAQIEKDITVRLHDDVEKNGVPVKPGLYELLKYLKDNGYKMAVASSSKKASVLHNLKSADVRDYFGAVVGGEDVARSKPNPDIFLKAAELLESDPSTCLVVEDSAAGINGAKNAKMKCICVPDMIIPEKEDLDKADAVLESLDKIIEYLKNEDMRV